jgi:ASC-1-like (ASCH) protein
MTARALHLALKAEYFHAIQTGAKTEEYRLANAFWAKRLQGKKFDRVVLTLGYPSCRDHARRIVKPWRGMRTTEIRHPLFGSKPVQVFAIDVSGPTINEQAPS